ncbi:MAG: hypothetical protein MK108_00440 [Mariniblastus sp.]|nr:hypothetical protein [Mariniblastus sp.]
MIRSILMALGIFLLILGVESLLVDKVVVKRPGSAGVVKQEKQETSPFQNAGYQSGSYYQATPQPKAEVKRAYHTREWMPWSLLAAGTITVLYTYSLAHGSSD